MRNLLRWQYVVPRVLAILVALLGVQYALCLVGQAHIEQAVSRTVGAKGELAAARVSFLDGRVTLSDLRIADPRQPMRNLLAADSCDFTFDTGSYVRRRSLVGYGSVSGLQFLSPRESSGALAAGGVPSAPAVVPFGENEAKIVATWMKEVDAKFSGSVDQLESLQLTAQLSQQGAQEIAALDKRIRELEARALQLQTQSAAAEENPLRGSDFLANLPNQLATLRADSTALASDLDRLPDRFDTGRRAIVAARVRDDKALRDRLGLNGSVAQPLAAYLMRERATQVASDLVGWLRWTRNLVPNRTRLAKSETQQPDSNEVTSELKRPSPALLLHTLSLAGTASLAGQQIPLAGSITDFTSEPWLLEQPMRLRLESATSPNVDLRATIDRSGAAARDELLVDMKGLKLPPQTLGRTEGVALALGESQATLSVSIQLTGEQLSGEIQLVQNGVQMQPTTGSDLGHVPLAATLNETLGDVHSLATRLTLRGTLAEPRASLWSSIGPATAKAMDIALRRAADEHSSRVMAAVQQKIDERLAQLDRKIADSRSDLSPRLAASTGQINTLATQISAPQRLQAERLGRLPAGSLFR